MHGFPRREGLTGAGAVLFATLASLLTLDLATALFSSAFAGLVAAAAVNDLADYRLPDSINAALLVLGLGFTLFESGGSVSSLLAPVASAVFVGALMLALRWTYGALRGRSGLGLGDVKLATAGAVWLPSELIAWALLIAAIAALLLALLLHGQAGRGQQIHPLLVPFGAFLGPALWLVWYLASLARVM